METLVNIHNVNNLINKPDAPVEDVTAALFGIRVDPQQDSYQRQTLTRRLTHQYDLPPRQALGLFGRSLQESFGIVERINEGAFVEVKSKTGFKEEIKQTTDDPFLLLKYARPEFEGATIDPELRAQVIRQFLIAHILAEVTSRNIRFDLEKKMQQVNELFDKHLYRSKVIGQTQEVQILSSHDSETNEARRVIILAPGIKTDLICDNSQHVKSHSIDVRDVSDIGLASFARRFKSPDSSVIKMLSKAWSNGGNLDIQNLSDVCGFKIVTFEDAKAPVDLMRRIYNIMLQNPEGLGKIRDFKMNDQIDKDRGQSVKVSFSRFLAEFEGWPVPLEGIVYPIENHLQAEYHVGTKDPETGFYTGAAHDLYKLRRLGTIAPFLYPDRFFGDIDFNKVLARRMDVMAYELKQRNRIDVV